MVMRNSGDSLLHNVRMIVSHPDVFCPLTNEELQQEPASTLSGAPSPPPPPVLLQQQHVSMHLKGTMVCKSRTVAASALSAGISTVARQASAEGQATA